MYKYTQIITNNRAVFLLGRGVHVQTNKKTHKIKYFLCHLMTTQIEFHILYF